MTPQFARSQARPFVTLLPMVGLLLVYTFSRIHGLLALPPFIDEFLHIQWAQDVYAGHWLTGAANGRLLALWWMSLFQLSGDGLLWITRTATVLFAMLGVAVVYNLGRAMDSRPAGLLAVVFYILTPFVFFHERLGLSDAYVSTLGLLVLWFSVRFAFRERNRDAILAGVILTAAIVAKANGLVLAVTPAIAFVILAPVARWPQAARGLLLAYGAFAVTFVPFYLFLRWRGWSYFGVATSVVGTASTSGLPGRFLDNIGRTWEMDVTYLSVVMLALCGVLTGYLLIRRWRIGLFLALSATVPLAALLAFATKISGRYILFHIPVLIVCLSVGLAALAADLRKRGGWLQTSAIPLTITVPLVWGVLFALPFQAQMRADPALVTLPPNDRLEYVEGDSSGFTLDSAADYLVKQAAENKRPLHVVGLLANCGGLGLNIPQSSGVTLECPVITWDGKQQPVLAALVNQRATETTAVDLWIVSETSPYISLEGITAPYEKVITFDRPGDLTQVSLYRVRKAG